MTTNREEIPSSYFLVEAHSLPLVATKLKELGLLVSDDVEKWSKNPSNGSNILFRTIMVAPFDILIMGSLKSNLVTNDIVLNHTFKISKQLSKF